MTTTPITTGKPGRNNPCPCGSGKKYKTCCQSTGIPPSIPNQSDPDIWLIQARQAVANGQLGHAEFCYREVIKSKPNDPESLAGIGQALCWQRKRSAGKEYLQKAARQLIRLSHKNRQPQALLQLSEQLQHWGDINTALELARLSLRLAPESAHAMNNLALCLLRINRTEEALATALKASELMPGQAASQILVALLESETGQLETARERLEKVIATCQEPEQTARAWLELGAVKDKQNDYNEAFKAFTRAAELHASLHAVRAIDVTEIFNNLARNQSGFDQTLLNRWQAADFADGHHPPGFLLGFLRSGTTLAEQVLGAHPDIVVSDENDFIFETIQELARISGITDNIPESLRKISLSEARQLRAFYWQRVFEEYGKDALRKCFVDKLSLNSIELGFIATLFPEARILFALRDPRDITISCFQQAFTLSRATVNLLSLEDIARQYAAVMDLWLHLRKHIQPSYHELRYEDTVTDFENTFRSVFTLLGVDWRPEVLLYHQRAKGRYISTPSFAAVSRPIYKTAVARWQHYAQHLEPVMPILNPYIQAFGYGVDSFE